MKKAILLFFALFLFCIHSHAVSFSNFDDEEFLINYLWAKEQNIKKENRPKVALVLGGGGARGFAHIGVFRLFEDEKIPVDLVVGTSIGSIAGAFYCAGISMDKVEELAKDINWKSLSNLSVPSVLSLLFSEKLLSNVRIEEFLKKNIGDLRFEELKIPLVCVATDLNTGEKVLLRSGSVAFAARASATVPGFFEPVEYRQRFLVDGGLVENIPVGVAKLFNPDIIIAVPVSADITKNTTNNVFETLMQSIYIQGKSIDREILTDADILIRPAVGELSAADLVNAYQAVDKGFLAAKDAVKNIKMTIINKTPERFFFE